MYSNEHAISFQGGALPRIYWYCEIPDACSDQRHGADFDYYNMSMETSHICFRCPFILSAVSNSVHVYVTQIYTFFRVDIKVYRK